MLRARLAQRLAGSYIQFDRDWFNGFADFLGKLEDAAADHRVIRAVDALARATQDIGERSTRKGSTQ